MINNGKYKKTNNAYVRSALHTILCLADRSNAH